MCQEVDIYHQLRCSRRTPLVLLVSGVPSFSHLKVLFPSVGVGHVRACVVSVNYIDRFAHISCLSSWPWYTLGVEFSRRSFWPFRALSPYPHHHSATGSREIGILPIFLFSDVRKHGGGTAVLRGSHKKVAKILWNRAGTTGLTGTAICRHDIVSTTPCFW